LPEWGEWLEGVSIPVGGGGKIGLWQTLKTTVKIVSYVTVKVKLGRSSQWVHAPAKRRDVHCGKGNGACNTER